PPCPFPSSPARRSSDLNFDDKHLKRAGLDYHDLADLKIHADFDACMEALPDARVFAFTTSATKWFSDVEYTDGDILLFGTEPSGDRKSTRLNSSHVSIS